MPQLMPLPWIFSLVIFLLFFMAKSFLYSEIILFESKLSENLNNKVMWFW